MLSEPQTETFNIDEVGIWKRTITVRDILSTYRTRYTPKAAARHRHGRSRGRRRQ